MRLQATVAGGRLIACVLLTGCAFGDASIDPVTVRDSAGVQIIESGRPLLPPGSWSISAAPVLTIGTVAGDPNYELVNVPAAIGLPDGGIVLSDGYEPLIRWYDAAGAFLRGVGRRGGGPAEFRYFQPSALWVLPGDSVATWEPEPVASLVKVFRPDGLFARSFRLKMPREFQVNGGPEFVGVTQAGYVILPHRTSTDSERGVLGEIVRDTAHYLGFRADGSFTGTLAQRPGSETYLEEPFGTHMRMRSPFFFSLLPIGRAAGNYLYYGSGDRYEIEVYDLDGKLVRLLRKQVARRPVDDGVRAASVRAYLDYGSPTPATKLRRQRDLRTRPFPDSMPAYRRMRIDSEGMLWVADYDVPGESAVSWSVFDTQGRWLTDMSLRTNWRVFEIGLDYILVLVTDALDVEYVQKFALSRSVSRNTVQDGRH